LLPRLKEPPLRAAHCVGLTGEFMFDGVADPTGQAPVSAAADTGHGGVVTEEQDLTQRDELIARPST
jgi:hypothetical protein